ncbi:MAG: hypothetical protein BAJATHORv1_20553 [Candidatus Thorarchaeota archaeon]|nr:MAG: hypothetical protein BAJATHORv1_20553 [Candidatus Thorarchaeota archaeon]
MPILSKVEIRTHALATEIPERVEEALLNLFPEKYREDIGINRTATEAHLGYPILVLQTTVKKKKLCQETLEYLLSHLNEGDKTFLLKSISHRVDDSCNFYLRLDKQQAYQGSIQLARTADMISIQFNYIKYTGCDPEEIETIISNLMQAES